MKLPLQVFAWDNISSGSLAVSLCGAPLIIVGAFAGIWFVKIVSDKYYRAFVIVMTVLSTVAMLL